MSEHDFEPVRGLPAELPEGERLLWQGAPDWFSLAQRAFHGRSVAIYFAILMVWRAGVVLMTGAGLGAAVNAALMLAPVVLIGLGLIALLAWLTARTSVYTITNKRLVMRFGVALPKAINIPFTIIESAAARTYGDKSGDVSISLTAPNKIPYLMLWPHARPWRLARPEPTLRAVANAEAGARILAAALQARVAPVATPASAPASPQPALATA
jgi:hypothetical protein